MTHSDSADEVLLSHKQKREMMEKNHNVLTTPETVIFHKNPYLENNPNNLINMQLPGVPSCTDLTYGLVIYCLLFIVYCLLFVSSLFFLIILLYQLI